MTDDDLRNLVGYFSRKYGLEFGELLSEAWIRLQVYNYEVVARAVHHAAVAMIRKSQMQRDVSFLTNELPEKPARQEFDFEDIDEFLWFVRGADDGDMAVMYLTWLGFTRPEICDQLGLDPMDVDRARKRVQYLARSRR